MISDALTKPVDAGEATTFHMNGYHKAVLGMFTADQLLDVTTSGTYTLTPLEEATPGVKVLRIPHQAQFYYVEYRQPYGLDVTLAPTDPRVTGVLIRVAPTSAVSAPSHLIDATTPNATGFADAALQLGATFSDGVITLTVASLSPAGAVVTITVP